MALLPFPQVEEGTIPEGVRLPGGLARVSRVAARLECAEKLAQNRGFHSSRGFRPGIPVGVTFSGAGAPGAALCAEEAIRAGRSDPRHRRRCCRPSLGEDHPHREVVRNAVALHPRSRLLPGSWERRRS